MSSDKAALQKFANLGLIPGKGFSSDDINQFNNAVAAAKQKIKSEWKSQPMAKKVNQLRLYQPRKEILNGTWKPPLVQKIK